MHIFDPGYRICQHARGVNPCYTIYEHLRFSENERKGRWTDGPVALILTALNPCVFRNIAAEKISAEEEPPIHP